MTSAPEPGGEIAGYRIQSVLGEGVTGTVYLAESPKGAVCALKVLSPRHVVDPTFATRFKREAEYAESLDHPHILDLYEAGQAPDGTLFFAMEYVDGTDLRRLLEREGTLEPPLAVTILGQIADALDCAHAKGLVHRDVKPGNIIVAEDPAGPHAYLTDFGLSKNPSEDSMALTQQGQMIGTMPYTAPEEILAQERDHRVDVYSLGCVLYEALVGEPPFVRERDIDVLYAHIGDPRPSATAARPGLPAGIDEVIAKAMAISPGERYSTCAEFIAAARALLPEGSQEVITAVESPTAAADTEPSMEPPSGLRLVVTSEVGHGHELVVEDEALLGRLTTFEGALATDQEISRRHARVYRAESGGGFLVEDQQSANGTFVNGVRIGEPHMLQNGDEVRIGATVLVANLGTAMNGAAAPQRARRLSLRMEVDLESGELTVAMDNGASARIVRDGDSWRVEQA
ncbi:MAG TPA: FHA domain-containing serine/threonine-protein kinase [Solirubrobacteraceae bacterium]|nr:FHA domain-containing serine/threonine-protein kinase [Solirubrobacteraceae bacterium]